MKGGIQHINSLVPASLKASNWGNICHSLNSVSREASKCQRLIIMQVSEINNYATLFIQKQAVMQHTVFLRVICASECILALLYLISYNTYQL
jgi:hypothetical protein